MPFNKKKMEKTENKPLSYNPENEFINEIKELKLENAHLKAIQSAMPDPYYIRDMDYNVVLWPDSIAKMMGFSAEEAKKMKCYEIFRASVCPPKSDCPTEHCIHVRQFLKDVAVDVYHKNGDTIHALVSNAGIYDEDGTVLGAVEIVKNNTVIQKSMDTIGQLIKNIESASITLNEAIDKTETISQEVNKKARESLESVKNGVNASTNVSEKARNSSDYAGNVQTNMATINESMGISSLKISALKEKSEKVIEFVKMIQEISSKTNLFAINASIEAAHAGESDRGFKVVADGIRELSKNSSESAHSIQETIREIVALIQETIVSIEITGKNISSGTSHITELLTFVTEINESSKVLLSIMNVIENAAAATSKFGDEQSITVIEVDKIGNELSEIAEKLRQEFEIVFKAMQRADMG
jgi:PAS domain S-box-containing protein